MSSSISKSLFNLPGFRFHPTDQELVDFYLEKKVQGTLDIPPALIHDVDFYNYDPWELAEVYSDMFSTDHYFFVPRDRKYPNGSRPKRVTATGFWKATGCDKRILTAEGECYGLKKTLVFYRGKAPRGIKTCWIMNEFRLLRSDLDLSNSIHSKVDVTLCKMYRKRSSYSSSVKLAVISEERKKEKERKNDGSAAAAKRMKCSASSSTITEKSDASSIKDELNSAEMFFWPCPDEDDLRLESLFSAIVPTFG